MKTILADRETGKPEAACIWNERTRHSVIFEPSAGKMHVAFPGDDGAPGNYTSVAVKGGT